MRPCPTDFGGVESGDFPLEELYSFADFVSAVAEEGNRCEAGRSGSRAAC
jgi:hypothetical protein